MDRGRFLKPAMVLSSLLLLPLPLLAATEPKTPSLSAPSAAEILARLRPGHPRLLASRDDFAQLKKRIASEARLQSWQTGLGNPARDILSAEPSRYEIPDGLRLLATSRRVVERVHTLALLYRLEGDDRYAERAWRELEAAAKFPDRLRLALRCLDTRAPSPAAAGDGGKRIQTGARAVSRPFKLDEDAPQLEPGLQWRHWHGRSGIGRRRTANRGRNPA